MSDRTGDFKDGATHGYAPNTEEGVVKPIAEPAPGEGSRGFAASEPYIPISSKTVARQREQGIEVPKSDTRGNGTSAPKTSGLTGDLRFYREVTAKISGGIGKKAVGMNDTIRIAHGLKTKLETTHAALQSHPDFAGHPNLAADGPIAKHLEAATNRLRLVNHYKAGQTPTAWLDLAEAGKSINKAHAALKEVSPAHADEISVPHQITNTRQPVNFRPGSELSEITRQPTEFREEGDSVNNTFVGRRPVKIDNKRRANLRVAGYEQKMGISGTSVIRPEARANFDARIAATPRVRKKDSVANQGVRKGVTSPKSDLPLANPLGEAAVQPSRVGDFGGSEKSVTGPGQGYPRNAEKAARIKKNVANSRIRKAAAKYQIAKKSDSVFAPVEVSRATTEYNKAGKEQFAAIQEQKAAANRDITYATGTPKPSAAQQRVRKARVQKAQEGK